MLRVLFGNHVFANLTFALILVSGFLAYGLLPRQQDPEMNFNWISIITYFPGASAEDVEKLVTNPIEEALEKLSDLRFVQSKSSEGYSSVLIRFQELDEAVFDKRVTDLRREIRNKQRDMPSEVTEPFILEITSANGFPTAMIAVRGAADDEVLRRQAHDVRQDLERIRGVDAVNPIGLRDPELHIRFFPEKMYGMGITPDVLVETIRQRFKDVSGGQLAVRGEGWLVRLSGSTPDPEVIAQWPIVGAKGEVPIGRVAEVARAREKATNLVRHDRQPAVLMPITKQANANSLELIERLNAFIVERNQLTAETGVTLTMVNDSTHLVRHSLQVMESNALFGLGMVLVVTWLFMGGRMALLISLGVPFSMAGVFGLLYSVDSSLNVMVLLGVVIVLGMLVDDAVVVIETIFNRIDRGMETMEASIESLREVFAPVLASVLTTVAAFLPLMLLPGILGKFMRIIPAVVSGALFISLIEAFWILPTHVVAMKINYSKPTRMHQWRRRIFTKLQRGYGRLLVKVLRRPRMALALSILPLVFAIGLVASEVVRVQFFAFDPMPMFYVNLEMPTGASLERTMAETLRVEQVVRAELRSHEVEAVVTYAGQMFTETEPLSGDRYGQILVSLIAKTEGRRGVVELVDLLRAKTDALNSPATISYLKLSGGPPITKPINVKVRGTEYSAIRAAVVDLKEIMRAMPEISDLTDNDTSGRGELTLAIKGEAVRRAGLQPSQVNQWTQLLADGAIAAAFQHHGEKVEVRVLAAPRSMQGVHELLDTPIALPDGGTIYFGELVESSIGRGMESIHHYNFRRTISVEAELNQERLDTVAANNLIRAEWAKIASRHPTITLDFTGMLDDIQESMQAIQLLFLFGLGLMYLILGTQFRSYWMPFMILTTVPMAFTGVVFGLALAGHPLSLYTLYGVVALSGIAVNSAIVLISAANDRRAVGMSPLHAIISASRRRLIPVLITTLTTIAGLFSLAVGIGGKSLLWGPVATSIVWGLSFSSLLTMFLIPIFYVIFVRKSKQVALRQPHC